MKLTEHFHRNQTYFYPGNITELENEMSKLTWPVVKKIAAKKYKISPVFSFGTLLLANGIGIERINVVVSIKEIDAQRQQVCFSTKLRVEHYLVAGICLISILAAIKQNEPLLTYPLILGIWILAHLFFQWIFSIQENQVIKGTVEQLHLIKGGESDS